MSSEHMTEKRSLGDLVKELRDETRTLFRQEVSLVKTEMSEKMSKATRNVSYIAMGGAVAFAGFIVLLIAASTGLAVALAGLGVGEVTTTWLAPLLVGGIVAIIGYSMISKGKNTLKNESAMPEKTVQTLKEDKEWLRNKAAH